MAEEDPNDILSKSFEMRDGNTNICLRKMKERQKRKEKKSSNEICLKERFSGKSISRSMRATGNSFLHAAIFREPMLVI